ncbi:MAG: hypothetical protein ACRDTG_05020, partial [Pseudonocardiaceae bacterium]
VWGEQAALTAVASPQTAITFPWSTAHRTVPDTGAVAVWTTDEWFLGEDARRLTAVISCTCPMAWVSNSGLGDEQVGGAVGELADGGASPVGAEVADEAGEVAGVLGDGTGTAVRRPGGSGGVRISQGASATTSR